MLRYVWKFTLDILPSVLATIIGAYIVNHYIVTKPGADAPAAAAISTAEPRKAEPKNDVKPSEAPAVLGNIPDPGVKARGISEKAMLEKTPGEKSAVAEKPALAEKPVALEKPAERSAEKPAQTASIPPETRRHHPGSREKAVAKSGPTPIQPSTQPSTPAVTVAPVVVAAPNAAAPPEAAIAPEDRRDANELARAAIERLRNSSEPRAKEAGRIPDAARAPETTGVASASPTAPMGSAPPVRPLPPPIMVSTPPTETLPAPVSPDPRRPTPPAEIPSGTQSQAPLDLSAEALQPQKREHTSVAEEMLLAAKSVFHSVLPK